jgi:hypothetical protein
VAAPGSATCPDDVSIDLVNIDQVNGQRGPTARVNWVPRVSETVRLTGGAHVSGAM